MNNWLFPTTQTFLFKIWTIVSMTQNHSFINYFQNKPNERYLIPRQVLIKRFVLSKALTKGSLIHKWILSYV